MSASNRLILSCSLTLLLLLMFVHARVALEAKLPGDMPPDARFLFSGYDLAHNEPKGNWVACRLDRTRAQDWCRVTDDRGTVVYQGAFLPLDAVQPLPNSALRIASSVDVKQFWIRAPHDGAPAPVIHLEDGSLLVPAEDRDALNDRWAARPDELQRITHSGS